MRTLINCARKLDGFKIHYLVSLCFPGVNAREHSLPKSSTGAHEMRSL